MAKVSIVKAKKDLKQSVKKAVDLIGGMKKFIKKGDSVLIKPNYNSDDPFPASSDPEFVRVVIELLRESGAGKIIIGESSGPFWKPTWDVLEKTGLLKVAETFNVEIKDFDTLKFVYKETGSKGKHLKGLKITDELYKYDRLVYLPCLKTHTNTRFTLSLKLAMGFPKTFERLKMHALNIEMKVAELNLLMKPDLILMDGRKCFVTGGPSQGDVEEPGMVLASTDRVAIDVEGVKILQSYKADNRLDMTVLELPLIKRSIDIGIGKPGTVVKG